MKRSTQPHQGVLITNGVILERHEMMTINFLLGLGKDIELIRSSFKYKTKSPDFWMDGLKWELKCPEGGGKYTIQDTLRRALKQSCYIVIDLRRAKLHSTRCVNEIQRQFSLAKNIRWIKIITKNKQVIDLKR